MLNYVYTFLFLIIFCNNTNQQQQHNIIPHIPCPNYFQYFKDGSKFFGRLSLPNQGNNIELYVHFAQLTPLPKNYPITNLLSLESSQSAKYRVDFPSPNEVPKLTKITVNGQDICLSTDYIPGHFTTFFLYYNFGNNAATLNKPQTSVLPQIFSQLLQQTQPAADVVTTFIPFQGTLPQTPHTSQPFQELAQPVQQVKEPANKILPQFNRRLTRPSVTESFNQPAAPQYGQCGEETSIAGFVVGGDELSPGQFPWLTAIYHRKESNLLFLCGGSLVSPRTVVSAGHCFKRFSLSANQLLVHLGRHNLEDFSDTSYVTRNIQNLIVHPDYNPDVFADADLAILQLESSVEYTRYIRPICLWTESSDITRIVSQTGYVAGWGADGTGHSSTSIPKKVSTNIVSHDECIKSSLTYKSVIAGRSFCAGNRDGTGPCTGDSGSGLVLYRNDRWYLRGIVSAGQMKQHLCDLNEFVTFCDVAKHLQWLQSQMVS